MRAPTSEAEPLFAALRRCPIVGIVRAEDADAAVAHVHSIVGSGVAAVEISLSTPDALAAIEHLHRSDAGIRDGATLLGAGTVMTPEQLRAAVAAGARFVVTPTTDPDVLAAARELRIPIIPGAATPTEVQRANLGGAAAVKLFPASLWSIRAFRDLRTVFTDTAFVPTGGIGAGEVDSWLAAGAMAVGLGSALTSGSLDVAHLLREIERPTP